MKNLTKKAQDMNGLQSLIMGIVGAAIVLVVGIIVVSELGGTATFSGNATVNSTVYSVGTGESQVAATSIMAKMVTIPTWIGVIIVVALAMITLSYFYNK